MACSRKKRTRGSVAGVAFVDEQRALLEQIAVAAERVVDDGVEQGMAGADEGGGGLAAVDRQRLFEGDALVAAQDGRSGTGRRGSRLRSAAGTWVIS